MKFIFICLLSLYHAGDPGPVVDFRNIFGADYTWACRWLSDHDSVFTASASRYNIPARELRSIVFPELVRYNQVFDAIQVESLKFLYVSEGRYYADFSVGYFQMKPSFAEEVEKDAIAILPAGSVLRQKMLSWYTPADDESSRRERVRRITSVDDQLVYLCAFYRICESRFPVSRFFAPNDRLKFFATCYNAGYQHTEAGISLFQTKKQFGKYNYADVSAFYFGER